ncbi:MAG: hypothetical protein IPJ77_14195 [Planctomycetes bacterium]|nr:hypothetical protein [Planctomycetota bacterium]
MTQELWFCWTAPAGGPFEIRTVGLTALDTKVAAFDGCGCPAAAPVACNDDACGTLVRMRTKPLSAGAASFPGPGDRALDVAGGTPLGSGLTGYYFTFYRNSSAAFCPPATANATNGYRITW